MSKSRIYLTRSLLVLVNVAFVAVLLTVQPEMVSIASDSPVSPPHWTVQFPE
jgi:hypothetical protein